MLTPRENLNLFGHQEAKASFVKTFHSSRFAHAWILGGHFGIGKTTFAFHLARYILSGRQDGNTRFAENDPLHRRMVAQSHGDLWTIGEGDKAEIGVDSIRQLNSFLNQTTAEGGWRVVLIDGVERLNLNAANALLKRLEEPPLKTVFLLSTPTPGRLLPTLRSRCQLLTLNSLSDDQVEDVLRSQGLTSPDFFAMAQGSPGRLMRFMEGEGPQIYADLQKILAGGRVDSFIHTYGGEEASYALIEDFLRIFLYKNLMAKLEKQASFFETLSFEYTLKMYEKVEDLLNQCQRAQLDKCATLTCVLATLKRCSA